VSVPLRFLLPATDPLDSTYQIAIWSVVETGLAILAGSLITLRPLFRWFLDGSSSYKHQHTPQQKTNKKYVLSTLTANASMPGIEDPKYWRPDLGEDPHTVVTSIMAPLGRSMDDNSTVALSPILPPPRKISVCVHQTFAVYKDPSSPVASSFGCPGQCSPAPVPASIQSATPSLIPTPAPAQAPRLDNGRRYNRGYGAGYAGYTYEF
jgi:hypothetical protein